MSGKWNLTTSHCRFEDVFLVSKLLSSKAEVNAHSFDNITPLEVAVSQFSLASDGIIPAEVVKLLVDHGADVHKSSKNGLSLLHVAVQKSDMAMVTALIDAGADVHKFYETNYYAHCKFIESTPLSIAYQQKDEDMIQRMFDLGCNISYNDTKQISILQQAVRDFDNKMFLFILKLGITESEFACGRNPLLEVYRHHTCCAETEQRINRVWMLKYMLCKNVPLTHVVEKITNLHESQTEENSTLVLELLRLFFLAGAKFDKDLLLNYADLKHDESFKEFVNEHCCNPVPLFYSCCFRIRKLFGLQMEAKLSELVKINIYQTVWQTH